MELEFRKQFQQHAKQYGGAGREITAEQILEARTFHDVLLAQLIMQYFRYSPTELKALYAKLDSRVEEDDYIWALFYRIYEYSYFLHELPKLMTKISEYPWLLCYNGNDYIRFESTLGRHEDQYVFQGIRLSDKKIVVIKWAATREETLDEIQNLLQAQFYGVTVPWFDTSYTFWHQEVLVMEKLEPLTYRDDAHEVGRQLLRSLQKLHCFAVHNDIKPDNIMKKNGKYYLIDYGGLTTKRKAYGFERGVWSLAWCSQIRESGQVTTAKYDLLELLYTLQYLDLWRENSVLPTEDIKDLVHKPWNEIGEMLRTYPETGLTSKVYEDFYEMLTLED